jgi:hypothetical protein
MQYVINIPDRDALGLDQECLLHNARNNTDLTTEDYVQFAVGNIARAAAHEFTRDPEVQARTAEILALQEQLTRVQETHAADLATLHTEKTLEREQQ